MDFFWESYRVWLAGICLTLYAITLLISLPTHVLEWPLALLIPCACATFFYLFSSVAGWVCIRDQFSGQSPFHFSEQERLDYIRNWSHFMNVMVFSFTGIILLFSTLVPIGTGLQFAVSVCVLTSGCGLGVMAIDAVIWTAFQYYGRRQSNEIVPDVQAVQMASHSSTSVSELSRFSESCSQSSNLDNTARLDDTVSEARVEAVSTTGRRSTSPAPSR